MRLVSADRILAASLEIPTLGSVEPTVASDDVSVSKPRVERMLRTLSKTQGSCHAPGIKNIVGAALFSVLIDADMVIEVVIEGFGKVSNVYKTRGVMRGPTSL